MSDDRPPSSHLTKTRVQSAPEMPAARGGSSPGKAVLVMIVGPNIGKQFDLADQPVEMGRDPACDFAVDNDLISRRHARIEFDGATHRIVDLGSTNGTFVNDHRITTKTLVDGDRVSVGKTILKYLSGNNIEAEYHQEIFHLMAHDGLTGIHNKRHYEEALQAEATKGYNPPQPLSLAVFDIDHFKKINDTHGHAAGDAVLRKLATTVDEIVPEGNLFARVGGEEFSVLCPGYDLSMVTQLCETIRGKIEGTRFEFAGTVIPVTTSVGAATRAPGSAQAGKSLFEAADARLYEAKNGGRNQVRAAASE